MNHSKTNLPFTNALALTGNADALREAHKQHIDNHNPQLHSQTGFTLIELMIVLAIFTIAGGAVYALFFSGQGTGDIVRAQAETSALSSALVGAYATRANFVDLTNESASQEGWLPKTMANGSGGPVNIWNHPITLSSVDMDVAGDRRGAAIQQDIPAKACARFVASVAPGFDLASVNDHRFIPTDAQNPDALAGPCGDAGDTAHVSLVRRKP